jgi:hypothetical protein
MRALADEVRRQPEALEEFGKSNLPRASRGSIFAGAGDSYAASLAAFYFSGGRCLALDPYVLVTQPQMAEGAEVFFVSVSGRTSSNVKAAERVRGVARRTTVLTADTKSPLAGEADRVVRLPMSYVPRMPGFLSFSLSLIAVLRIAGGSILCDFRSAFKKAEKDEGQISYGRGTTYFLGNSLAHPAAIYAAAKTYELLGAKAHGELLEEFSHLELFSLEKSDVVNVLSCFDPAGMSGKLERALVNRGFESNRLPTRGGSDAERLFHAVFAAQLSVLRKARQERLSRPRFLSARERLGVSDSMIY